MTITLQSRKTSIVGLLADKTSGTEDRFSIGDLVHVELEYVLSGTHSDDTTDFTLDDSFITANVAAFIQTGQRWFPSRRAPQSYATSIEGGAVAQSFPMPLQGSPESVFANDNIDIVFEVITNKTFKVVLDFTITSDMLDYLRGRRMSNGYRLTRPSFDATAEGDLSIDSVFTGVKNLAVVLGIETNKERINKEAFIPFNVRWYNSELDGSAGTREKNNTLEAAGNAVENIQLYEDTTLKMLVDVTGLSYDETRLIVIKENEGPNVRDWKTDLEFVQLDLTAGQTGSIVKSSVINLVGDDLSIDVVIDKTKVNVGEKYRLIVKPSFSDRTLAFTTKSLLASSLPQPLDFPITGKWIDYVDSYDDNIISAPQERLRNQIQLDSLVYDQQSQVVEGNHVTFDQDFRKIYITIKDAGTGEVFWNYVWTREQLQDYDDSDPYLSFNEAPNRLQVELDLRAMWVNGQGLPDWTDKDIEVVWNFEFYYNIGTEWIARYERTSKLNVREYTNESGSTTGIAYLALLDADTGVPIANVCSVERVNVFAKLTPDLIAETNDYMLIAFVDTEPFGAAIFANGSLKEYEVQAATQIPQLQQAPIQLPSTTFDTNGNAVFTIDIADLPQGVQWRVSAIAKRLP